MDMVNELSGKCLRYLIGADEPVSHVRHYGVDDIVEVGYDWEFTLRGRVTIGYCNLFNEKYSEQNAAERAALGPYLSTSDTAQEYNEGQIDPAGVGWDRNLRRQFDRRDRQGFKYIELDNPDAYSVKDVLSAIELASVVYDFDVIAKNPLIMDGDPTPYVAKCVGVIVERGCGSPNDMDVLRKKAGKPDMPVWFVAFGGGMRWARKVANGCRAFKEMRVTYSTVGEYTNSVDVSLAP
jgi:hypothetical protein